MKVKVNSAEFKKALSDVKSTASNKIFGAGHVGLLFSGNTLSIKAFASFWIEIRIECLCIAEEKFVSISPASIGAICLYCDDKETELDISDDNVKIKSGSFRTLHDVTNDDLSPSGVDLDEINWLELPRSTVDIVKVFTVDDVTQEMNVLYVSDHITWVGRYMIATHRPGWEFDGFIPVPMQVMLEAIKGLGPEDELLITSNGKLITVSFGETYITTPYPTHWEKPPHEEMYGASDGLVKLSSGAGKVSDLLSRELAVCSMQSEMGNSIFLWTDEDESGLRFKSVKSEYGENSGLLWSDLSDFRARCDASFLSKVIPKPNNQMWSMHLITIKSQMALREEPGRRIQGQILVETESGIRYAISVQHSEEKDFTISGSEKDASE